MLPSGLQSTVTIQTCVEPSHHIENPPHNLRGVSSAKPLKSVHDEPKIILSLFDASGSWSDPYRQAGYHVVQVDIKLGTSVLDITQGWLSRHVLKFGRVHGVLAAPPCTHFSSSGAQYWKVKDLDGRTKEAVELVRVTLRIIQLLDPTWWVLENPVGRIQQLVPELKAFGPWFFQPWQFGAWLQPGEKSLDWGPMPAQDAYTKKTGLYGKFNRPIQRPVEPIRVRCSSGKAYSPIHWATREGSELTKTIRSTTPKGFARAFFSSNL